MQSERTPRAPGAPPGRRTPAQRYYSFLPWRFSRGAFLVWLRRTHAWLGLWGAALGVLFGVTGILLNHRAVLKIPAARAEQSVVQLSLPQPPPTDVKAFAAWLQHELRLEKRWEGARADPPRTVVWGGQEVQQPERWVVTFGAPSGFVFAEYWVGNAFATVRRFRPNLWGFLNNLHTASGVGAAWVLLADSIAGSFIVLALTGLLLWSRLHGPRLLAVGLGLGSLLLGVWFAWQAM